MTKLTYSDVIDLSIRVMTDIRDQDRDPIDDVEVDYTKVVEKLEALKVSLANRKSSSKSPTKTQKENAIIMENMVASMAEIGTPCTVTELLKYGIEGYELSNQNYTIAPDADKDGKVTKTMEGKKALFSLT